MITIDHAYIINLDRSKDRYAKVTSQLNDEGISYTRFAAIDGYNMNLATRMEGTTEQCMKTCSNGIVGCGMSHLKLWEHIMDSSSPENHYLIMEDDVILNKDFKKRLNVYLSEVPLDFDIVYIGCLVGCDPDGKMTVSQKAHKWATNHGKTGRRLSEHVFIPSLALGTHCYIVSKKGARKLFHLSKGKVDTHIDHQIQRYAEDLEIFAIHPSMARQVQSQSSSTIATANFPRFLMQPLDMVHYSEDMTVAYILSISPRRLWGVEFNVTISLFFVIGLMAARFHWPMSTLLYIFTFLLLPDITVGGDMIHVVVAYILLIAPSVYLKRFLS